ncbi:MAG: hypothetical protein LBN36_03520, partial [Clostridiales Family XIII bacterium]|nr:hypothetical protein [Clostridiales Family XIII bacterium]
MTTSNWFPEGLSGGGLPYANGASTQDPSSYGLPSEGEIARIAAGYFPEFDVPAIHTLAGAPDAIRSGSDAIRSEAEAYRPKSESYAPTLSQIGEAESAGSAAAKIELQGKAKVPDAYEATSFEKSKYIGDVSLAQIRAGFPILSEK